MEGPPAPKLALAKNISSLAVQLWTAKATAGPLSEALQSILDLLYDNAMLIVAMLEEMDSDRPEGRAALGRAAATLQDARNYVLQGILVPRDQSDSLISTLVTQMMAAHTILKEELRVSRAKVAPATLHKVEAPSHQPGQKSGLPKELDILLTDLLLLGTSSVPLESNEKVVRCMAKLAVGSHDKRGEAMADLTDFLMNPVNLEEAAIAGMIPLVLPLLQRRVEEANAHVHEQDTVAMEIPGSSSPKQSVQFKQVDIIGPIVEGLVGIDVSIQNRGGRLLVTLAHEGCQMQKGTPVLQHVIGRLLYLASAGEALVQGQALRALANMTADEHVDKATFVSAGVFQWLAPVCYHQNSEVQEGVLRVIGNLVTGEPMRVPEGVVPHLVRFLNSQHKALKDGALRALINLCGPCDVDKHFLSMVAIPSIIGLLDSREPGLQEKALRALVRLSDCCNVYASLEVDRLILRRLGSAEHGSQDTLPPILLFLDSTESGLQAAAARAMAMFGPWGQRNLGLTAIPRLVRLLKSTDKELKREAIGALAEQWLHLHPEYQSAIAREGAIPLLVQLLESTDDAIQEGAVGVLDCLLGGLKPEEFCASLSEDQSASALRSLGHLLASRNVAAQKSAALALSKLAFWDDTRSAFAETGTIPQLIPYLLESRDVCLQSIGTKILTNRASCGFDQDFALAARNAIPSLVQLLACTDTDLQDSAAVALGTLVNKCITMQPDFAADCVALGALAGLARWLERSDHKLQASLAEASTTATEGVAKAVFTLLREGPVELTTSAITRDTVASLVRLLDDTRPPVQEAAVGAIAYMVDKSPGQIYLIAQAGAVPKLERLLDYPNPALQVLAAQALANLPRNALSYSYYVLKRALQVFVDALGRASYQVLASASHLLHPRMAGAVAHSVGQSLALEQELSGFLLQKIDFSSLQQIEEIGRGSCGRVYLAKWQELEVAVKLFSGVWEEALTEGDTELDLPDSVFRNLLKEASIMAGVRHPNVLSVMGFCARPPCMVLEYCSQGSLAEVLKKGRGSPEFAAHLTWQRRLQMMLDTAIGMLHLHSCPLPILHRDLKSPNLLVNATWQVKVGDFNLSKVSQGTAVLSSIQPSNPRWLAPEVLWGKTASMASDVYSFGVVLWEMLTWQLPFEGKRDWQVYWDVTCGKRLEVPSYDLLPGPDTATFTDLLSDYEGLMMRCLAQTPSERPSFEEIAKALRAMLTILPRP